MVDPGIVFFELEESVEVLCLSSPSPVLIAILIQLSKRTRRLVWNFLVNPEMGGFDWCIEFCAELYKYHEKRPRLPCTMYNGHPNFATLDGTKYKPEFSYVINKTYIYDELGDGEPAIYVDLMAALPIIYHNKNVNITREIIRKRPAVELFEWYFVACALNLRIDLGVANAGLDRKKGTIIFPQDEMLFIEQSYKKIDK